MLLFGSSCCSDGWRRDAGTGGITYAGSFVSYLSLRRTRKIDLFEYDLSNKTLIGAIEK